MRGVLAASFLRDVPEPISSVLLQPAGQYHENTSGASAQLTDTELKAMIVWLISLEKGR